MVTEWAYGHVHAMYLLLNKSMGQHGFDVENDTVSSQEIIKHTLAFLHEHLFKPM